MNDALEDVTRLMETLRSRFGEIKAFDGLLSQISVALSEIVDLMEKPDASIAEAITAGFKGMQMSAPPVNVAAPEINMTAPEVNVTVQPAQVVIMPAAEVQSSVSRGWNIVITSRDGNGAIRGIS